MVITMTKLIISIIIFLLIFVYRLNFYYKQTKSKSYVISIIKRDIKNLLFGFIVVFTLYWIVDKYEEATDLTNMRKQEFDKKLYIPLTEEEKKIWNTK
jgi:fumarate reductase subunit D